MNKKFSAFGQSESVSAINGKSKIAATLNAQQFFTENNVNGYFSKKLFIAFGLSLSDSEAEHFENLLKFMSQGCSINNIVKPTFDKNNGIEMLWFKIRLTNATINLRIPHTDELMNLVKDFQLGKFYVNVTLAELQEECQELAIKL
ncbi:hypothetical protein [Pedobacter sp. N23S346]|uniref:hypothetical protein n=1 Tax=Pedobacter sp. N23S346 TaxID=3402750 RepID=UPI003ABE9D6C